MFFVSGRLPNDIHANWTAACATDFTLLEKQVVTSGSTPSVIQTAAFHDRVNWLSCCGTGPILLKAVAAFRTPGLHKFDYSQEIVDILQIHFGRNTLHLPCLEIKRSLQLASEHVSARNNERVSLSQPMATAVFSGEVFLNR